MSAKTVSQASNKEESQKKTGYSAVNLFSNVTGAISGMSSAVTGAVTGTSKAHAKLDEGDSFNDEEVEAPELSDEGARHKEDALAFMLRSAKNKYIARKLQGKIFIEMTYGVVTSGEFCEVSASDTMEELEGETVNQLSSLNFRVVSAMDSVLANLSRRSKQWESVDFKSDVTLTQGLELGVSIPLILSVSFKTKINFEVTVKSLVEYRKRKDRLRHSAKQLKSIPDAQEMIAEVESGGFSLFLRRIIETSFACSNAILPFALSF